MSTGHRAGRSPAFTLIEMLVVIGIIAVLAALLLPALTHAREKARRTTCLNNLNQFSKALESYCSDSAGYFPCYPGWGVDPSRFAYGHGGVIYKSYINNIEYACQMTGVIPADAVVTDQPVSLPIFGGAGTSGISCGLAFPGVNFFRTIFFGAPAIFKGSTVKGTNPMAAEACFCGPVGLGNLITGSYLQDAKVFMCPSAEGMPYDAGASHAGLTKGDLLTLMTNTGLNDADALRGGNYPQLAYNYGAPVVGGQQTGWQNQANVYGFQCSYNYRGVPISTGGAPLLFTGLGKGGVPYTTAALTTVGVGVPQDALGLPCADFTDTTTPGIKAYAGCPEYKSQKLLGHRAICSDTFSKWDEAPQGVFSSYLTADHTLGYGTWAHKTGYNVLYGDWHAKFLEDAEGKVLHWSQANAGGTALDYADISASIATITYPTIPSSRIAANYSVLPTSAVTGAKTVNLISASEGFLVWHFLDTQAEIDVASAGASSSSGTAQ